MRGEGGDADGNVDEEDPLPGEEIGEDPAHEHAGRGAEAADRAPGAERDVALAPSVKVVVRIESAAGVIVAAPRPWRARAAMSDSSLQARPHRREPTEKMTRPAMKMTLTPENVRQTPAEQEETAEDERVGADHPLQVLLREAKIRLDRRQGDVHDGDVEHDDELRDAEERQREPFVRSDVIIGFPPCVVSS